MKTKKIIKYASITIASLVLAFIILLLSMYVIKPLLNGWPLTVEQAANKVISQMDQESLTRLKAMKKEDLIMLHMGFGQGIRNDFGLWRGNMLLLRNTGTHHPDDASMVIIEAAWQKLRKN